MGLGKSVPAASTSACACIGAPPALALVLPAVAGGGAPAGSHTTASCDALLMPDEELALCHSAVLPRSVLLAALLRSTCAPCMAHEVPWSCWLPASRTKVRGRQCCWCPLLPCGATSCAWACGPDAHAASPAATAAAAAAYSPPCRLLLLLCMWPPLARCFAAAAAAAALVSGDACAGTLALPADAVLSCSGLPNWSEARSPPCRLVRSCACAACSGDATAARVSSGGCAAAAPPLHCCSAACCGTASGCLLHSLCSGFTTCLLKLPCGTQPRAREGVGCGAGWLPHASAAAAVPVPPGLPNYNRAHKCSRSRCKGDAAMLRA